MERFIKIDNSQKYFITKSAIPAAKQLHKKGGCILAEKTDGESAPKIFVRDIPLNISLCAENLDILSRLDNRSADVLDYVVSRILSEKPKIDGDIKINIDSMLSTFGLKNNTYAKGKETNGHNIKQRRQYYNYLQDLSDLWIITGQTNVKGRVEQEEQHLFQIKKRVTVGNLNIKEVTLQINSFFDDLILSKEQKTILLPLQILEMDPYRRATEKQIGRYLCRFAARGEANFHIARLFTECNIDVDLLRKSAFRKKIETALNRLVEAEVITSYDYLNRTDNFNLWLDSKIRVVFPKYNVLH